jgi:DNA-binding XRE family transcriptional regulator
LDTGSFPCPADVARLGTYLPVPGLKTNRIRAGLTRAELAKEVGVPQIILRDLERPDRVARLPLIRQLAHVLGIRPEDIVFGEPTIVPGNPD